MTGAARLLERAHEAARGPLRDELVRAGRRLLAKGPPVTPPGPRAAGPAPPIALFRDVDVAPAAPVDGEVPQHGKGRAWGPLWPDFEARTWERHNIRGVPVDVAPRLDAPPAERLDRPAMWLGYVSGHFGHLVAEQTARVLWSRALRPNDLGLVVAVTGPTGLLGLAPPFWDVMAWLGVPRGALRLVRRPLRVRELRVVPQAEQHLGPGPGAGILDLLDAHVARSGLRPVPVRALYVARTGMISRGGGAHAGEGYLVRLLRDRGVAVLDPAAAPLREQLARHAGAERLIFAEGSAVHGRQLLGRLGQQVTVLNRRRRARIAEAALAPRVAVLSHVEAAREEVVPVGLRGLRFQARSLAIYDVEALLAGLAAAGIDLSGAWDDRAYAAARDADLALWARSIREAAPGRIDVAATLARLEGHAPSPSLAT